MHKTHTYKHTKSCSVQKNRWKEHQIFEKWDDFSKSAILKIGKGYGHAKARAFAKWSVWVKN